MRKIRGTIARKKRKAFALAETIIALLILAIALLAMALVPVMSTKLALQTVQKEQALTLAGEKLDILEALEAPLVNSRDVVGIFTLTYSRSFADKEAVVEVAWGGITKESKVTLRRDMSEEARITAKAYKD